MILRRFLGMMMTAALLVSCGRAPAGSPGSITSMPVSDGEVTILAKGWNGNELQRILSDFEKKYELNAGTLQAVAAPDGLFRIRLERPLEATYVPFLINYIHYPEGLDLQARSPIAVAVVRLDQAFGATSPSMMGHHAAFYVAANDTAYDEIYAKVDSGAAYRLSFTNLDWEPTPDPRLPAAAEALLAKASSIAP